MDTHPQQLQQYKKEDRERALQRLKSFHEAGIAIVEALYRTKSVQSPSDLRDAGLVTENDNGYPPVNEVLDLFEKVVLIDSHYLNGATRFFSPVPPENEGRLEGINTLDWRVKRVKNRKY